VKNTCFLDPLPCLSISLIIGVIRKRITVSDLSLLLKKMNHFRIKIVVNNKLARIYASLKMKSALNICSVKSTLPEYPQKISGRSSYRYFLELMHETCFMRTEFILKSSVVEYKTTFLYHVAAVIFQKTGLLFSVHCSNNYYYPDIAQFRIKS